MGARSKLHESDCLLIMNISEHLVKIHVEISSTAVCVLPYSALLLYNMQSTYEITFRPSIFAHALLT